MQKITTFLWFNDNAEEAVKFYTSIFKNSKIGKVSRYPDSVAKHSGQRAGSVMTITFTLNQNGVRATTSVPSGWTANSGACWVREQGGSCS